MCDSSRRLFAAGLRELIRRSGLTLDRLAARLEANCPEVTPQRLSDWQRGTNVPSSWKVVKALISAVVAYIDGHQRLPPVPGELRDLARWRRLWRAAANRVGRKPCPTGDDPAADDNCRIGCRVAMRVSVTDVDSVVVVLGILQRFDAIAFSILAERCGRRRVDDVQACTRLAAELEGLGADDAAATLAHRIACSRG
ncbi:MAG TPA: hypothetical protein VJ870_15255 [Amycolatopsis sp.]|nr:hypothetical protein [Amycolatopsis sp.]